MYSWERLGEGDFKLLTVLVKKITLTQPLPDYRERSKSFTS